MADGARPGFDAVRGGLIEAVSAGATVDEAARRLGVNVNTVRSWLAKGRKEPQGRYGRFASEIDAVRSLQRLPDSSERAAMTHEELERLLAERIRAGSVPAMRLWLDLHPKDQAAAAGDPFSEFDPQ